MVMKVLHDLNDPICGGWIGLKHAEVYLRYVFEENEYTHKYTHVFLIDFIYFL